MIDVAEPEQSGIGLRHYLDVIRRRKWIVLGVTAASIAAALTFSALQTPKYRATTTFVVGQGGGLLPATSIGAAAQPLSATMAELVKKRVVAESVIEHLTLDMQPETLLDKLSVSFNPETAAITVDVVDSNEIRAGQIAEQIDQIFPALVKTKLAQTITGARTGEDDEITVSVWDPAHVVPGRVQPKPVRNTLIAALLGGILGLLAAFLREHFDRALRTRESVEQAFGVPVIGQIPFVRQRKRDRRGVFAGGPGQGAEAFRALRANLQYLAVKRPLRTILITSPSPEQGKTTVAANLAVAIAQSGASTVVVEGDLRRPRLDAAFNVPDERAGLTSVLVGSADVDDALVEVNLPASAERAQYGDDAGRVAILPSGPLPPNPSELLSSLQMTDLLERLASTYDYVLIDSPPVLAVADALELARVVDGVVLVVRRNRASTDEAREFRALVDRLGLNLVGVVFTDVAQTGAYGYGAYADRRPPAAAQDGARLALGRSRAERESLAREEL